MSEQQQFGRNRDSLAGLNEQLEEIFRSQPTVKKRADGQLILPVTSMREVLRLLFDQVGMAQLTEEDEDKLEKITSTNPNIELDSATLLEFVAQLTANMPRSAGTGRFPRKSSPNNEAYILGARGRGYDRNGSGDSRSSSSDSLERNYEYDADDTQRVPPSPFDVRAKQRGGHVQPPSSWSSRRPVPAARRRKSDAGSNYGDSDNESAYGHGRRRPSNPVSPSSSYQQSGMVTPPHRQGSVPPGGRRSRPGSRSHSSMGGYTFPSSHRSESPDAVLVQYSPPSDSAPLPGGENEGQEGEEGAEGQDKDLIPDPRLSLISFTSSTGDSLEQTETLRKTLAEVTKRAADSEKHLQDQLSARELDLEDVQAQLENTREMINTLRKDEKEWRSKERHYVTQINGLETEINRLQRNLDSARAQHHTLSKQHAEQTADADKYRETVRERDAEARQLEHQISTYEHDLDKARQEHELAEGQVKQLQSELAKISEVHAEYLNQKQENVFLKETIDRLRYDLDELRTSHAADSGKGSLPGSARPSLSRSLGSELLRKLHTRRDDSLTESDADTVEEVSMSEQVEGSENDEDVFQTIITRKKIAGKGKRMPVVRETVMVDASTQYDKELFTTEAESDTKPVASTSRGPQVKVEPVSPASRFLQLPRDDPPSYQLSEIEQSGEETLNILRKWHGVKVLGPLPGGISREAIEDWHALKRELGIKCPIIEEIIEQSDKQAGTSRNFGFSPMRRESARRYMEGGKRRFYNIYNTYILGGDRSATESTTEAGPRQSTVDVLSAGKWVVAIGAWSAFLLWYGSSGEMARLVAPGSPTYTDRALWSSFNALAGGAGEGFGVVGTAPPVDAVGAVWFVVEKLVRGATDIATRRVAFPS